MQKNHTVIQYDPVLLITAFALLLLGVVMVISASIAIAERDFAQPFYFGIRQGIFVVLGCVLGYIALHIPLKIWDKMGPLFLCLCLLLLVLVLIPGIGVEVNGARRWIQLGIGRFQVSELVKLSMVIYLAGYLLRHHNEVQHSLQGFIKPNLILVIMTLLLLLEPDFGAVVVLASICLGMLFLAGVSLRYFFLMIGVCVSVFTVLAISAPYRWERLTAFLNPWADQFDSGYQLTQALIAFGRGAWFGVGLGAGVQKLFYLPEAHTDFLFAVIGEEFGLLGASIVLVLFAILVCRGLLIARNALLAKQYFAGYLAYGLSLWLGCQALISMGVNTGLLPTKGLTLPLMSYGGSSLLVSIIAIALLLRIDNETRHHVASNRKSGYVI